MKNIYKVLLGISLGIFVLFVSGLNDVKAVSCGHFCQDEGYDGGWCKNDFNFYTEWWTGYSNLVGDGTGSSINPNNCYLRTQSNWYFSASTWQITSCGAVYCHCYEIDGPVLECNNSQEGCYPPEWGEGSPSCKIYCDEGGEDCDWEGALKPEGKVLDTEGECPGAAGCEEVTCDCIMDGGGTGNNYIPDPPETRWYLPIPNCFDINCQWLNDKKNAGEWDEDWGAEPTVDIQAEYQGGVVYGPYVVSCMAGSVKSESKPKCSPIFDTCDEDPIPQCPLGMTTEDTGIEWTGGLSYLEEEGETGLAYTIKLVPPYKILPDEPVPGDGVLMETGSQCYLLPNYYSNNYWCPAMTALTATPNQELGEEFIHSISVCTAEGCPEGNIIPGEKCRWYTCGDPFPGDPCDGFSAYFEVSDTQVALEEIILIDNLSQVGSWSNANFDWDYDGDGVNDSNTKENTHAYAYSNAGNYTIELTATETIGGIDCSDSHSEIVEVVDCETEDIDYKAWHRMPAQMIQLNWAYIADIRFDLEDAYDSSDYSDILFDFGGDYSDSTPNYFHSFLTQLESMGIGSHEFPVTLTAEHIDSGCPVKKVKNIHFPSVPLLTYPVNGEAIALGVDEFKITVVMNNGVFNSGTDDDRVLMFWGDSPDSADGYSDTEADSCRFKENDNDGAIIYCDYEGPQELGVTYYLWVRAYNGIGDRGTSISEPSQFSYDTLAWFQLDATNYPAFVHTDGLTGGSINKSLKSVIPSVCASTPGCQPYLFNNSVSVNSFLSTINGRVDLGEEEETENNIFKNATGITAKTGKYEARTADYFYFRKKMDGYLENSIVDSGQEIDNLVREDEDHPMFATQTAYDNEGNQTLRLGDETETQTITKNAVIIHRGDAEIEGNIEVEDDTVFLLIVSGNITIKDDVTHLEGLYVAGDENLGGGEIILSSDGQDLPFTFEGSLIAWNNIRMQRSLADNTFPAETFSFRPDIVRALRENYDKLKYFKFTWRELRP